MPTMADISVLKNDGTTAILWTGVSASSGLGTPATWQSQTIGTAQSHRPDFRFSARDTGKNRAIRSTFVYPFIYTNSTTGLTLVADRITADINFSVPKTITQATVDEAVSQFANILKHALLQACFKSQVAPT